MDFNIDPMSAVLFQPQENGELWAVDEVVQFGSNTEDMCRALDENFGSTDRGLLFTPTQLADKGSMREARQTWTS
ncbi:hypothetical protein ABVN80_14690 [Acinetobacter baumannii]